jgi:elongation factor G
MSGGHGHFARIKVLFEPNPGKGFEFVNAIRGEAVPKEFAEAVKEGSEEALASGLLLGYPTVDVKVTLLDGKTHSVDSAKPDFKQAAILAFRGDKREEKELRKKELGVVLLEPIMQLEVEASKDYQGVIIASLGSRRTTIEDTEVKENSVYVRGKTPLRELLTRNVREKKVSDYSTVLRQLTKSGSYSMFPSHYQEVPHEVLQEILKEESIS